MINFSQYHFNILTTIRQQLSQDNEIRGDEKKVEQIYDNLSNTLQHEKCFLEFKRRFNEKIGNIFQIPDYDNPTPEKRTDGLITNDRKKLGRLTLGTFNFKLQLKYRNPTTYFTVGLKRNYVHQCEKENIAILFAIPKTSDPTYYNKKGHINTKEHLFFLWIPNHFKFKTFCYCDNPKNLDIFFDLNELKKILDFELLEKDQSILNDFIEGVTNV